MGRKSKLPLIIAALEGIESTSKRRIGITPGELQERTGVSAGSVHLHLHALHAAGRIYIVGWKVEGSHPRSARYRLGNKPDAPKPLPLTRAEVARRFRARALRNGSIEDLRERSRMSARRTYWRQKPPRRDQFVAALFGHGVQESAA